MREIKFRAWDGRIGIERMLSSHEAVRELSVVPGYKGHNFYIETPNIEKVILMQYTGLKDKNGVEIYEGDVLADFGGSSPYVIEDLPDLYWRCGEWGDPTDTEVIGNIYENPELIGAES